MTFESHHEPLDAWAVYERIGHYVNYRKQSSPSRHDLLPANDYRLFAVCARFPEGPARHDMLIPISEGVYELHV